MAGCVVNAPDLTADEVAAELNATRRYVISELRRKNLRGYKLSGSAGWRVQRADLDRYKAALANVSRVRGA